jgi:hypothetical protein
MVLHDLCFNYRVDAVSPFLNDFFFIHQVA